MGQIHLTSYTTTEAFYWKTHTHAPPPHTHTHTHVHICTEASHKYVTHFSLWEKLAFFFLSVFSSLLGCQPQVCILVMWVIHNGVKGRQLDACHCRHGSRKNSIWKRLYSLTRCFKENQKLLINNIIKKLRKMKYI